MFDRYHITNAPDKVTHNHKYPTTSDQLRNLRETENQVRSSIVSNHNFDNQIRGRVTTFFDHEFETHTIVVSFSINGEKLEVTENVTRRDFDLDEREALEKLAQAIINAYSGKIWDMVKNLQNRRVR